MADNMNENEFTQQLNIPVNVDTSAIPAAESELKAFQKVYQDVVKTLGQNPMVMDQDTFQKNIREGAKLAGQSLDEYLLKLSLAANEARKMSVDTSSMSRMLTDLMAGISQRTDSVYDGLKNITGVQVDRDGLFSADIAKNINDAADAIIRINSALPEISKSSLLELRLPGINQTNLGNLNKTVDIFIEKAKGIKSEGDSATASMVSLGNEAAKLSRHLLQLNQWRAQGFADRLGAENKKQLFGSDEDINTLKQRMDTWSSAYSTTVDDMMQTVQTAADRFSVSEADAAMRILKGFEPQLDRQSSLDDFAKAISGILEQRVLQEHSMYQQLAAKQAEHEKENASEVTKILSGMHRSDDQIKGFFETDWTQWSPKHLLGGLMETADRKEFSRQTQAQMTKDGAAAGEAWTKSFNEARDATIATPQKVTERNNSLLNSQGQALAKALNDGYANMQVDTSAVDAISERIKTSLEAGNKDIIEQVESLSKRLSKAYAKIPDAIKRTEKGNIVNTTAMDANTAAAGIQNMIDKLSHLSTAMTTSDDYNNAVKEVEKLTKKIEEAKQKQQQFVLQTQNTKIGGQYAEMERQMSAYAKTALAAQRKIIELNSIIRENGGENSLAVQTMQYDNMPIKKALATYRHELKVAMEATDKLAAREQNLLQNSSYAGSKSTFVGYSVKIAELNMQLEQAIAKVQELEAAGAATNSAEIAAQTSELVSEINTKFKELSKLTLGASLEQKKLQRNFGATAEKLRGIKVPDGMKKTDAFKELEKNYRSAYKSLQTLADLQQKYIQNGTSVDSKSWKNLSIDIENAKNKLAEYSALMDKSVADGSAFQPKETTRDAFKWGKELGNALSTGFKSFKSTAAKEFKFIHNLINKITSGVKDWFKNQKSLSDNAKQMYKTFTSYLSMLRTRIRRKFISMVFEDLQANIGKVAQISPRFNKALSEFIVSTKTLGAQIVTAFEPLAVAVLPLLTKFVDYLTYAADQMAQFVSKLMGDDTYIKATKGQYDYAASLDETTGKTKKATKAAKEYENTVLSFDQLHKLNGNNSGNDSDDLGLDATDLKNMKDSANAVNEIAEKIHDAFANGDYFGAGQAIAEAVNGWFGWLKDVAGWEENSEKFTRWMDHAIDVANGFVDGWDSIGNGEAIGDVTNTLINLADQFFSPDSEVGFHFEEAGRKLGETFIAALTEIDWNTAGSALMNGVQAIPRMINGFLKSQVAVDKSGNSHSTYMDAITGQLRLKDTDEIVNENEYKLMSAGKALGYGLRKMFSSAVDTFDPEVWSDMLGGLINSFFDFIEELFIDANKAAAFGTKIGQLINQTFEKIDSNSVAGGINAFTQSFMRFFDAAFNELDLGSIGSKIWDVLTKIDWDTLFASLGIFLAPAIISGLIAGIGSFAGTAGKALIVGKIFKSLGLGSAAGEAATGGGLLAKAGKLGKWGLAGLIGTAGAQVGGWTGINASAMLGFMDDDWAQEYNKNPLHNAQNAWKASWLNIARLFAPEWSEQQMNKIRSEYTDTDYYRKVTGADNAQSGPTALSTAISSALDETFGAKMQEFMEQQTQSFKDQLPDWISKESAGDGFIENQKTQMATILPAADGSVLSSAPTEDFRKGLVEDFTNAISEAFESGADPTVVLQVGVIELGRATLQGWRQINKAQNPNVVVSY